jgi:site-specific DNA-methyltransferase (adenine-specific)
LHILDLGLIHGDVNRGDFRGVKFWGYSTPYPPLSPYSRPYLPPKTHPPFTMKTLPTAQIYTKPDRQRSSLPDEHIGQLHGSIFAPNGPGLINPIVLERDPADGKMYLVAGECRLTAIKLGYRLGKTFTHAGQPVPVGEVPYLDFGELSELARREIEYAENAIREDLTWQDNVKAIEQLDALRKLQNPSHTDSDTAKELFKRADGGYRDTVVKSKILAQHLDNPEIAKASSFKEAKKILAKIEDREVRVKLAAATGKVAASDRMTCHHANCLEWMALQPPEQFDVILTDPPYGMGADSFGDGAGRLAGTTHQYSDSAGDTKELLATAIPEFYRLAKPEAHLYLWCDIDLFPWLRETCSAAGWWVHRTPLINVKPEGGRVPWPEHGPRRSYELCLYAVKGRKPVTAILPDVFESRLTEGNMGHGAQKPVAAYVNLLKRSVKPGDRVFDAFAGSGTIFPAAAEVGCYAVGTEQEASSYGLCVRRISELK